MGRPLNKKYFGNRNVGTGGYQYQVDESGQVITRADDFIGGEGIAGLNITNGGNYINRLPTLATFSGPSEPNGVQSTGVLHSVAINCNPLAKGSGYQIGDLITDRNGSVWRVTKLRVVSATLNTSGSNSNWDGTEWIVWDQFINSHWTSPVILKGITQSSHYITGFNVGASVYGVWDGTDGTHAPTTAQTIVGGPNSPSMTPNYNTRGNGDYNGSGSGDNNGAGGSITFTYGVEAAVIVTSADYAYGTSYYYGSNNTQASVSPAGGTGVTLDVGFAADHLAVTEKGSGYIGTESVVFTSTSGGGEVTAVGTIVLTTDSGDRPGYGDLNANTNQENAILIYAKTTSGGTVQLGDIIKQEGSRRYKILTRDGIAVCKLVAGVPAYQEATITATDSTGHTYYVTKLTAHRALLVPYGSAGHQFPSSTQNGVTVYQSAEWTFGSATLNSTVKVANA